MAAGRTGRVDGVVLKHLPLIWAGLWRRPVRSVLTAICIVIAFVLLGLLQGVNAGFARAIANAHREFLVTRTRVRGGAPLPISAMAQIRALPGVKAVAPRAYFMGGYREPGVRNSVAAIATYPEVFFFSHEPQVACGHRCLTRQPDRDARHPRASRALGMEGRRYGHTELLHPQGRWQFQ